MMPNASAVILETMRWRSADESEKNMSNSKNIVVEHIGRFLGNEYRNSEPIIKGIIVNIVHGVTVQQIIDETGKKVTILLTQITSKFPTGLLSGLQLFLVEVQHVNSSLKFVIYEAHFGDDRQCKFCKCE